jgi:uncharacterized membrane protein YdbT with pleckstrin-like domain
MKKLLLVLLLIFIFLGCSGKPSTGFVATKEHIINRDNIQLSKKYNSFIHKGIRYYEIPHEVFLKSQNNGDEIATYPKIFHNGKVYTTERF